MANYCLSTRAQYDVVDIYGYGIKYFGRSQATDYLLELENFQVEPSERPELAKGASSISNALNKVLQFQGPPFFMCSILNMKYLW